jgi:choline dehydrogenase-like flavoprotein
MIIDLEQAGELAPSHSSVCVAGAGAAGICLALELAKCGLSVALLESGGWNEEPATQALYASEISGVPHAGIHKGRFRVLGGSTTHWAGQILELDSNNFDARPWIANCGWPFPKQVLQPYYLRALELEGLGSVVSEDDAIWESIHCAAPDFGEDLEPFFSRWCLEPNFVRLHGEKLRNSRNIIVYLHANLREIHLAESHENLNGLRCQTLGGRGATFTADHYVFCMGGIESARVLMQPLARAHTAPWNVHDNVGRYFQDHIDATLLEIKPASRRLLHLWFDNVYRSSFKYHPYVKLSPRAQERLECLAVSASFSFDSAKSEAYEELISVARQMFRGNVRGGTLARAAGYLPLGGFVVRKAVRRFLQGRGYNASEGGVFLRFHSEQAPNRESRIELSSERDATGMFRSRLHWAVTDQEIHTMQQFARVIGQEFCRGGFAEVIPNPSLAQGGSELISRFEDSYHHMGATRMANSPQWGVVDSNLRLFGVRNGYVCSSSVFPTSGFSNPTHTIIALAVRLSDHLGNLMQGRVNQRCATVSI